MIVLNRMETYLKAVGLWVLFFCVSVQMGNGQIAYDNNWLIGYGAFSGIDTIKVARFNFSDRVLNLSADTIGARFRGQNLVMSDREGNLLFYSNGCKLWDANHEVIPGSDPLLPGEFHEEWCVGGSWKGMPRVRTMMGLPFELSEDSTLYYIYHVRDSFVNEPYFNAIAYIREHAVLHTDSGLEVLYTDSAITSNITYTGFFTAVRHANNRDWWVIHPLYDDTLFNAKASFESILINDHGSRGGEEVVESNGSELALNPRGRASGQLVSDLSGSKLASIGVGNEFLYMDFDRETGEIEAIVRDSLAIWDPPYIVFRGAQFSPNGRFVYVSVDSLLYQMDTEGEDFPNNAEKIAITDRVNSSGRKDDISLMQMGRDCKIYIMTQSNTDFFHIIHRPDEKGEASMPDIRGIRLPTLNAITIPTFPNYRLGTPYENWCDSLTTSADGPLVPSSQGRWLLWPNPARDQVSLAHTADMKDMHSVVIYDQMGRQVFERHFRQLRPTYQLDLSALSAGLYYVRMTTSEGKTQTVKLVKME